MKLIVAWFAVAIATVVAATSCSIHHTSNQFECTSQAVCTPLGRTCVDGYCIVGPGGVIDAPRSIDAPMSRPDARVCPTQCSSCDPTTKHCKIDCAVTSCTNAVMCPPGWNCEVLCTTPNACRNGVDCGNALSCDVQCTGTSTCRDVACGAGRCNVNCTGTGSCRNVQCGSACACDVTCGNAALCNPIMCTGFQCSDAGAVARRRGSPAATPVRNRRRPRQPADAPVRSDDRLLLDPRGSRRAIGSP